MDKPIEILDDIYQVGVLGLINLNHVASSVEIQDYIKSIDKQQ